MTLDWGMVQVVEHLPSKHKALRSNSSTAKKKQKNKTHPNSIAVFFFLSLSFFLSRKFAFVVGCF
jgi:hypothetical protein